MRASQLPRLTLLPGVGATILILAGFLLLAPAAAQGAAAFAVLATAGAWGALMWWQARAGAREIEPAELPPEPATADVAGADACRGEVLEQCQAVHADLERVRQIVGGGGGGRGRGF